MRNEHSIAAIVFYGKEYLLLKYEMGHWGLVKGNIEKNESEAETIIRELEEETGIKEAEIINGFKESYEYYYRLEGELIHKIVNCLLIKVHNKEVTLSYEHTDYDWLPYEKALERLSHQNTKNILKKAQKYLSK